MIGVTLFGVLLTPVFYYVIERLKGEKHAPRDPDAKPPAITTALAVPVPPVAPPQPTGRVKAMPLSSA